MNMFCEAVVTPKKRGLRDIAIVYVQHFCRVSSLRFVLFFLIDHTRPSLLSDLVKKFHKLVVRRASLNFKNSLPLLVYQDVEADSELGAVEARSLLGFFLKNPGRLIPLGKKYKLLKYRFILGKSKLN